MKIRVYARIYDYENLVECNVEHMACLTMHYSIIDLLASFCGKMSNKIVV